MRINYHTHTPRCNHASGTEREYVEAAISIGMKKLGFSDHAPYPFPDPELYYTISAMKLEQLGEYADSILALKKEYSKEIEIYLGLETEYYPAFFERHIANLSQYPFEYLILGQHFLENGKVGYNSNRGYEDPESLRQYCDLVIAGIESGRFTFVAHPDLFYFKGKKDIYEEQMRRLCKSAHDHAVPLEINLQGIANNRHYPGADFWRIAGEEGCIATIGLDAHKVEHFQCKESLQKAMEIIDRHHLHFVEDVKPVNPFA